MIERLVADCLARPQSEICLLLSAASKKIGRFIHELVAYDESYHILVAQVLISARAILETMPKFKQSTGTHAKLI